MHPRQADGAPWSSCLKRSFEPSHVDFLFYEILRTDFETFDGYSLVYVPFNVLEGLVWVGFFYYLLRRHLRHRKTPWEVTYAVSFLLFGASDFAEVFVLPVWPLLAKAILFGSILYCRRIVLRHYPGRKI